MYTMVMMAALTTGIDMPDRGGRRGGGCCGCYGGGGYGMGMGMGYGGCYGGMGMGMGYGGCYGGMGMGYGGMGWGGGYGYGGGGMRGGYGYGGYTMGSIAPLMGSYAYSPMGSNWGWGNTLGTAGGIANQGATQSFYFGGGNTGNEATIVVHLPAQANLTIDGQQTQQRSDLRTFTSPPLEPGKVYTYTLRAEMDRDGHTVRDSKTIDVRAGQRSEVTLKFNNANREGEVRAPASPSSP